MISVGFVFQGITKKLVTVIFHLNVMLLSGNSKGNFTVSSQTLAFKLRSVYHTKMGKIFCNDTTSELAGKCQLSIFGFACSPHCSLLCQTSSGKVVNTNF